LARDVHLHPFDTQKGKAAMPVIKRILCPVDFSDTAAVGAREAAALASAADAELLLVHALSEPWLASRDRPGYPAAVAQQYEMIARRKLELSAAPLAKLSRVRCVLVRGAVHEAIAQAAVKHSADLIVMGTRSRKGLSGILADSMTERVMRHARVPVVRVSPSVQRRTTQNLMERQSMA
jgi:nucleotide-binding universal stress UspA family protein